jgi:DNA-binding MarR family transcriptional regulator
VSQTAVLKLPRTLATGSPRRTSYLVKRVETLVRVRLEAGLRDYGITSGQYMLLSLVSREGGLSSAELARRTSVTPQSMNESITALEAKALIRRTEDRDNRRILHIALTREGRRLLSLCDKTVDRVENDLFGTIGMARLDDLRVSLESLLDAVTESEAG